MWTIKSVSKYSLSYLLSDEKVGYHDFVHLKSSFFFFMEFNLSMEYFLIKFYLVSEFNFCILTLNKNSVPDRDRGSNVTSPR